MKKEYIQGEIMGKENLHEANWIVLLISLLINFTFIIIYVVEAIKGQRGWATVFIFIGILFITYGGTLRLYFKDKSHPKIKYSTLYSFIIVYLYTMVTFKYALTFIFIFVN